MSRAEPAQVANDVLQTLHARFVAAMDVRIRETLEPLLRESTDAAHNLGGAPEVHDEKVWHIGRAQGLLDALHALAPMFGGEITAPLTVSPRAASVVPQQAVRAANSGARHLAGRGHHRSVS